VYTIDFFFSAGAKYLQDNNKYIVLMMIDIFLIFGISTVRKFGVSFFLWYLLYIFFQAADVI